MKTCYTNEVKHLRATVIKWYNNEKISYKWWWIMEEKTIGAGLIWSCRVKKKYGGCWKMYIKRRNHTMVEDKGSEALRNLWIESKVVYKI